MNEVFAAMVTLAREARGLSQTQLAGLLGISQAHLSRVESGVSPATASLRLALSRHLLFPEHFFSQSDTVYGAGTSEFFHRKRASVPTKVLAQIHARMNIHQIHVARMLRAIELPDLRITQMELGDLGNNPAEAARAVRATWNLPTGPVQNLTKSIEDAGGLIVRCHFGTQQVDAISRWIPGLPPMFFLGDRAPVDRDRLSLAHELGHLVMHKVPSSEMEWQANAFAAELLMPELEIRPFLSGDLSLDKLAALKPYWRVSMAALLRRAESLRLVSQRKARSMWIGLAVHGYQQREPVELDLSPEQPTLLGEMFGFYRNDLGYSVSELATFLAVYEDDLAALYDIRAEANVARHQIRRVK